MAGEIRSPGSVPVRAVAAAVAETVEVAVAAETVEAAAVIVAAAVVIEEVAAPVSAVAAATVRASHLLPPGRDEQQERENPRHN